MAAKAKQVEHSERAHALLSASGSSRWMNCTPSAVLESGFPNTSSVFAEEGTVAHELAELQLRKATTDFPEYNVETEKFLKKNKHIYSAEMRDHVKMYTDYVQEVYAQALTTDPAALIFTEVKVDLTKFIPEGFGTVDNVVIANGTMHVIDLKFGKGVKVSAFHNSQLKLYAIGALMEYEFLFDINSVVLHIHQPRIDNVSTFELSADDLTTWAEMQVKPKADMAIKGEGEQVTGDWCGFCRAKSRCKALATQALEVAQKDFADPRLMSDDEVLQVYNLSDRLIRWLSSLGDFLLSEALAGKKWEGFKVVEGRSNRAITDKNKAIEILRANNWNDSDFLKSDLKGLGDLEKLLGKKGFEELLGSVVAKAPGKPTLAPATDKRSEFSSASDFD